MSEGDAVFDEDGGPVPAQDFALEEVERALGEVEFGQEDFDGVYLTPKRVEFLCEGMDRMMKWIWQSGMKNPDGVKIRSIIMCWIWLKELRSLSLTDMATGYGLKKQSLGRWVDDFKKNFPNVRLPHMRS